MKSRIAAAGLTTIDDKLQAGERLTFEDGVHLFETPDLLAVGWLANRDRERRQQCLHAGECFADRSLYGRMERIVGPEQRDGFDVRLGAYRPHLGGDQCQLRLGSGVERQPDRQDWGGLAAEHGRIDELHRYADPARRARIGQYSWARG